MKNYKPECADMESLFDSSSVPVVITDENGIIRHFNRGAEKLYGEKAEQAEGKRYIDVLYPSEDTEKRNGFDEAVQKAGILKKGVNFRCEGIDAGGIKKCTEMSVIPVYTQNGGLKSFIYVVFDSTKIKNRIDRLEYLNERYTTLLTLLPDIVYMIDHEGNFVFISESVKSIGYEPAQLIGKHFKTIVHPKDFPNVCREYVLPKYKGKITGPEKSPKLFDERRSGERMTSNLELRLLPKSRKQNDGPVVILSAVNASGHYEYYENGNLKFLGTIGVIRDITDRKKAEKEKIRLERQLFQAQKMEAIGQLAGGIAHDFNNMLSGITGYAEVVRRRNRKPKGGFRDEQLDKHMKVIVEAAERAGDLTKKLLAFSRKGKYRIVTVDIHRTIDESISLLSHTVDKKIKINKKYNAASSHVQGDPGQLQNVIINLATNARDAMPGGGELTFETSLVDLDDDFVFSLPYEVNPGKYFLLRVSDQGIGMDEEVQKHIYEPFYTTKDSGKGTGLGMASVYGTIKNHNGFIDVESSPGNGSVFSVYLPFHEGREEVDDRDTDKLLIKGSGTILIIDDEEIVRQIIAQMLKDLGYNSMSASNGKEAVEIYESRSREIDLVILDMNMPVMSGDECFSRLVEINPDIKVIIITGYSVYRDTQKIIAGKNVGFIQKPFKISQISEEVNKMIARKES